MVGVGSWGVMGESILVYGGGGVLGYGGGGSWGVVGKACLSRGVDVGMSCWGKVVGGMRNNINCSVCGRRWYECCRVVETAKELFIVVVFVVVVDINGW